MKQAQNPQPVSFGRQKAWGRGQGQGGFWTEGQAQAGPEGTPWPARRATGADRLGQEAPLRGESD